MQPIDSPLQLARHRPRGQALVELGLLLPVLLLLLVGALDLGRVFYAQITITNAAKEGALVAARGGTYDPNTGCGDANTVKCGVLAEATGGFVQVDQTRVTQEPNTAVACPEDATLGDKVTVTVTSPFQFITPLVGQGLTLSATASAECAVFPQTAFVPPPPPTPTPTPGATPTPTPGPTPCPFVVPAVDGLAAPGAANAAITGAGLTPSGSVVSTGTPNGLARNQSPAAGTCVAGGSAVSYVYRPGAPTPTPTPTPAPTPTPTPTPTPCAFVVPTVNGLAAPGAANAAITGAGLTPSSTVVSNGPKDGLARSQSPAAGTCVASGSVVSYVYRP